MRYFEGACSQDLIEESMSSLGSYDVVRLGLDFRL
jgi:hypothetical protein